MWSWSDRTGVLRRREKGTREYLLSLCVHKEKAMWGYREKVVVYKSRREVLSETNPTGALILDFKLPELWEDKFVFFKPFSRWCFVQEPDHTNTGGLASERGKKKTGIKDF